MMATSTLKNGQTISFEVATTKTMPDVASFFTEAFWLSSTTFPGIELSASDKRQLTQKIIEDLGPRYGLLADKTATMMGGRLKKGFPGRSLFDTRLLLAREPGGAIVGCAGIEAAFYDEASGDVFRSAQADRLVRAEIDRMDDEESQVAIKVCTHARSRSLCSLPAASSD